MDEENEENCLLDSMFQHYQLCFCYQPNIIGTDLQSYIGFTPEKLTGNNPRNGTLSIKHYFFAL